MAQTTPSTDWQVAGSSCKVSLSDFSEADDYNATQHNQFLIRITASIFTNHQHLQSDSDDSPPTEETQCTQLRLLDLLMDENKSRDEIAETLLSHLHVPTSICESMVDQIVTQALAEEQSCRPFIDDGMVVHMAVDICVSIDAFGGLDSADEPRFVAASKSSIENLARTRATVEVATACSICMEEMVVGTSDEVTRMPCSHLYHTECIVNWLEKSRVCPLCRYPMPAADPSTAANSGDR